MGSFGERIRELRQQVGLTQWQIADRTGVSNTYISALESGRKPAPPRAIVTALAACLQTNEDELWNLARAEREERLRQRIDGVPTSRRTAPPGEPSGLEHGTPLPEQVVQRAIRTLKQAALDPRRRRSLARTFEDLAKRLHEDS
jgi:transcriptional regulator with XRE-family HTH domain